MCRHATATAIITQCFSKRADEPGGCLLRETEVISCAALLLSYSQVDGKKKW